MLRIWLRPKGAIDATNDVLLAAGSDRARDNVRGPSAVAISVASAVQDVRRIRAEHTRFISRKNRAGTYQFTASRTFETLAEAGRFILTHGSSIPLAGTLIFEWGPDKDEPRVLMLGAVLRQVGEMRQTGVSVQTAYSVSFSTAIEAPFDTIQREIDLFDFGALRSRLINCGGEELEGGWEDDIHWSSAVNTTYTIAEPTGFGDVPVEVYKKGRRLPNNGNGYYIPLPAGVYTVRLHFCEREADASSNKRLFDITINYNKVENQLDVFQEAGGEAIALVREYTGVVHDGGGMAIKFEKITRGAIISGIQIEPEVE